MRTYGTNELSSDNTVSVLMLIATLLSFIDANESTKKSNKLRKMLRISITDFEINDKHGYKRCSESANKAWEYAKEKLDDKEYIINITSSCRALYALLDGSPIQNMWFTEKVFIQAMASIDGRQKKLSEEEAQYEVSSNILVDLFAEYLGIKKKSKLSTLKKTIEYNIILEGK